MEGLPGPADPICSSLPEAMLMTTATLPPRAAVRPTLFPETTLHVERTDIVFADVAPGRVGIEIAVRNRGDERSDATAAVLLAAPLGAFVPWQPLAVLPISALAPGEAAVLKTEARRPAVKPLGPPDRVPPRRLLTALGAADDRPQPPQPPPPLGVLPAALMDLLGQPNLHWAGNLNVFVGGRAVERHLARALRVYPGRVNVAMFVVGSGPDAYRFHLIGEGEDWGATLFDSTDGQTLRLDVRRRRPVEEGRWIETPGQRLMILALKPSPDCGEGKVEVHVEQRSTAQSAVVEFSLDPDAAGPGCFVV
jgi:hypothetical protein